MFRIFDQGTQLCDGLTRREWLRVGGLGLAGLSLPALLQAKTQAAKAKSCIVLFLAGGPPQHETWDPKPDAPAEIRGPFKPIPSSVPGLHVGELMPRIARLADKVCVLRAMSTGDNAHSSSGYYMLTGQPHRPKGVENARPGAPNDWPCLGAMVKRLLPGKGAMPTAITLPEHQWNDGNIPWPGQDGGFLGRAADPWLIHCDPSERDFRVPALSMSEEVSPHRFDERRGLLGQVNRHLEGVDRSNAVSRFDEWSTQAFDLLRSPQAGRAFDLTQEPTRVRERYGMHRFSQSMLLARRLVEARVPLIQINWTRHKDKKAPNQGGWDTHGAHAESLKNWLMPPMDQAYSALLEDLAERGLLDETLVVWMGEFGRTPRFNAGGGRDHWGSVFSIALAGGGVRGGQVIGSSDSQGAQPRDGRAEPPDLLATIFHALGISTDAEIHDTQGRPLAVTRGEVIPHVF
jgi:hypothetical protein